MDRRVNSHNLIYDITIMGKLVCLHCEEDLFEFNYAIETHLKFMKSLKNSDYITKGN